MNNSKKPKSRVQSLQTSLQKTLHLWCTKMPLQCNLMPNAPAVDTATPETTALLLARSASTVTMLDILHLYADGPEAQGIQGEERVNLVKEVH